MRRDHRSQVVSVNAAQGSGSSYGNPSEQHDATTVPLPGLLRRGVCYRLLTRRHGTLATRRIVVVVESRARSCYFNDPSVYFHRLLHGCSWDSKLEHFVSQLH